jgi:hypothetical protein
MPLDGGVLWRVGWFDGISGNFLFLFMDMVVDHFLLSNNMGDGISGNFLFLFMDMAVAHFLSFMIFPYAGLPFLTVMSLNCHVSL